MMILAGETHKFKAVYKDGLYWLTKSAEHDLADAQYELALLYEKGYKGAFINPAGARIWFDRAAANGHAKAKAKLKEYSEKLR
jgi:localization factor PodJL